MASTSISLDWSLLPAVLSVADHGSLSAAARQTGLSQPTLGRQIRAAEAALGGPLFDRHARGLSPTDLMQTLLPHLRNMQEAAEALKLQAAGQAEATTGTIRLTASHVVSGFLLPPILARFRETHPGLSVELAPSDTTQNLLFHEADIALRMYRPTQLDMVTRHLGDLPIGPDAHEGPTDRSLLILPGDGIGPEVMAEVRKIIDWFGAQGDRSSTSARTSSAAAAYDAHGTRSRRDHGQGAGGRRGPSRRRRRAEIRQARLSA
jgi:DNA-binding transcriptional LysR family regulator